jgi:hypothetical protein
MKVTNTLIQPPSLVAQIEGKSNKAIQEKTKEMTQDIPKEEVVNEEQEVQKKIDFLI